MNPSQSKNDAENIAAMLRIARDGVIETLGDKWPEAFRVTRAEIQHAMEHSKESNVLACVLAILEASKESKRDPVLLFATACEMIDSRSPLAPEVTHEP